MDAAIELDGVFKSYGEAPALAGATFTVPRGQICGFLGPNGAGKTTAIRMLFDLIRPDAGSARVMGLDCQKDGPRVRSLMGYLPGDLHLYENLSAAKQMELLSEVRGERGVSEFGRELCSRLDLDATKRIGSLSKGNRQKVGLLLALMHRPAVLVLDEPTTGLDPLAQEEVDRILLELAAEGHTVFFSSHVLSEVERICQRVVIIRGGRVVAEEDVANLKGRSLHLLQVTFASPVPKDAFSLPDVEELRRDGAIVHLRVAANIDTVLKAIARYEVLDIRTEQPSLEDIFLTYYKSQDDAGLTGRNTKDGVKIA